MLAWRMRKHAPSKHQYMNTHQSTYALLVRSEEKNRSVLETALYAIFILSAVVSIWQFARQTNALPLDSVTSPAYVVCTQDAASS